MVCDDNDMGNHGGLELSVKLSFISNNTNETDTF